MRESESAEIGEMSHVSLSLSLSLPPSRSLIHFPSHGDCGRLVNVAACRVRLGWDVRGGGEVGWGALEGEEGGGGRGELVS